MIGLVRSEVVSRQLFWIGIVAVFPLLIVLLGILPLRQTKAVSAVVAEILAHTFAWAVILFGLFFWIPRTKITLTSFKAEIPAFTQSAFELNDFLLRVWSNRPYLIVGVLLGVFIVDGSVLFMLWKRNAKFAIRTAWSVSMTTIPLVIVAFGEAATFFPLAKLLNEISG